MARKRWRRSLPSLAIMVVIALEGCSSASHLATVHTYASAGDRSEGPPSAPTTLATVPSTTTTVDQPMTTSPANVLRPGTTDRPVGTTTTTALPATEPRTCQGGWVLSPGPLSGPGLYAVGDVYDYEYQVGNETFSGLCTYGAPSAGTNNGDPPCPDKADLTAPGGSTPIGDYGPPGQLWAIYWNRAYPDFYEPGAACTYVGP